jgi:hypothetical protein
MAGSRNLERWVAGVGLLGVLGLSSAAFSKRAKDYIRTRDGGKSAESGEEGVLEIAHYNHDRNKENYNRAENGRCLTRREHYADHFNRHGTRGLGLSEEDNTWALKSIWKRMSRCERRDLPKPEMVGQDFIPRKRKTKS